ncbi:hypothetical protein ABZ372_34415 [Streptomyces sp. NPDC005921]
MEDTLDQQLRHDSGLSHLQYSVLVFLSEAPEGRLRMTDLAENLKYGFGYLRKLLAQNPKFVRGTQDSSDLVGTGDYVADFGSGGSASGLSQVTLPKRSPWVASAALVARGLTVVRPAATAPSTRASAVRRKNLRKVEWGMARLQ